MPKYGVHSIIMDEAAAKSSEEIKNLLQTHRGAGLLGSIGPDLMFFSPEYEAFDFFMSMGQNFLEIKKAFINVKNAINNVIEPIEDAIEEYAAPIVEAVDTIEKILPLSCIDGLVDDVKTASSSFKSALQSTLLAGIDGGVDIINDALDLPNFSHFLFDKLFTPAHQSGKREWDWYWFDMLHYRNSGLFAKNLLKNAVSNNEKAYALGYMTHVAADTVGHAYVNRIVCGPYRLHPQRHVIIENFIDSATYKNHHNVSVNKALNADLLSAMEDPVNGICSVHESGSVLSFSSEICGLLDKAFRDTYPDKATTQADTKAPRPEYLSTGEINKTFENFHLVLSILRDSYVEKPVGLDERYQDVADALNDILSQFEAPPSPPDTGNTGFCLSLECIEHFLENIAEWMAWFGELAKWTFDTIVNALDLLLELACQAAIAVVRAVLYLIEYLSYQLYQEMQFILALNGYVCPEPTHALDDPRGEILIHTGATAPTIYSTSLTTNLGYRYTYPRSHDHMGNAVNPPATPIETPATSFPKYSDDYPESYIWDDPWPDNNGTPNVNEVMSPFANAETPAETRNLTSLISATGGPAVPLKFGNAVDLATWMMSSGLDVIAKENETNEKEPLSDVVFCNWDLDADRGYAYKQWFTSVNPSNDHTDLDEKYLNEDLSRD